MNLLAEVKEGLSISWEAIRANKMRSALTTLGIVIGVVTVTLMGTAIQGLDRAFLDNISAIGADILYVERFEWFTGSREDWLRMQKRPRITLEQAEQLEGQLTMSRAVAPVASRDRPVRYGRAESASVRIIGSTEQYQYTGGISIAKGRFFSEQEARGGRPVCVIGSEVAENLFRDEPPVGRRIRIDQQSFEINGVLEKQGSLLGLISLDNQIIVPLPQFTAYFRNNPDVTIQVKVIAVDQIEEAKEELRAVMRRIRGLAPAEPDDFGINQQDQFVQIFHRLGGTIAAIGLFITALSLFVGGIGIMNIMFVSVAERTREIGIRKAVGAKRRTILLQFLIEAACICLLGGCLALAIAWPLTLVMQRFMPAALSPPIVLIALMVSLITGVISGFLPAWRAARMNPVDALRNE